MAFSPQSNPSTRRKSIPRPPPSPSPLRSSSPHPSIPTTPQQQQPGPSQVPPRRPSVPAVSTTPPPKTRARDLLRKHYGLGIGPPPPLPGGKPNPMDFDSPAFDAKSYYEQLITTSSLPALLKRENELFTEIRELDSERQSLVYNHHHELIAASDTIAAVKTRAESLDTDLDLLKAAFSEISRLGTEVAFEHDTPDNSDSHRR